MKLTEDIRSITYLKENAAKTTAGQRLLSKNPSSSFIRETISVIETFWRTKPC